MKSGLYSWCKQCTTESERSKAKAKADAKAKALAALIEKEMRFGRECTRCKTLKPLSSFKRDPNKRAGRDTRCKDCLKPDAKASQALRYQKHREAIRERNERWNKLHADQVRATRMLNRAEGRKLLSDPYLVNLLTQRCDLPRSAIPPKLIAIKREDLLVKRLRKEINAVVEEIRPKNDPDQSAEKAQITDEQRREARNAAYRLRYEANKERERARVRAYKAAHPEKVAAQRARATERNRRKASAEHAGADKHAQPMMTT
jgi:hypothetical protein